MYEAIDTMEDTPSYSKGDIVWVKLSSYWWPGEVINAEDLPDDLLSDFKKPPLAIVKFFDEDSYEYVKNWLNINPYNSTKKSEFIKKGMAGFRAKLSHMAKFPKDIGTAEERTSGNPNILSQPEFLPVKKINYDDIFGTPSPKKSTKGKMSLPSTKKTPARDNNQPHITHRRFLGNDDYRAYICIQYPGKDRKWDSDDEEIKKLNEEPEKLLTCSSCSFKTRRLEVMILHTKMHIQGIYITSKRKTKKLKGADAGSDSDSDTAVTKSPPKPKQRKKKEVKPKTTDVFTNLLDEWNDTDEEMEETIAIKRPLKAKKKSVEVVKRASDGKKEDIKNDKDDDENKSTTNEASNISANAESTEPQPSLKNTQDDIKNCFDFDEEEEDDDILLPTSVGRKIPRVIPEKPKPSISELMEQSQKEDELERAKAVSESVGEAEKSSNSTENGTDVSKKEILISRSFNRTPDVDENIENTFKELMAETELPALDDLAQNLKPEQNFHDARTVKFPDKGGTALKGGTTSKGGTYKKRFVTSFEDFEAGFRKLEDDKERSKKLGGDKEVKLTTMPRVPQTLLDDSKDQTAQPSDETLNEGNSGVDVPSETVKPIETCDITAEVPEKQSSTRTKKNKRSSTASESAEPQADAISTSLVEQKSDDRSDTVVIVGRRKTRQSDKEKSVEPELDHQEYDGETAKEATSQEAPLDSRRKSSKRRTKQFVIEEDSEEIIEITKECDTDDGLVEGAVQLSEEAKEKLAAIDLEIETLKRSLESTESAGVCQETSDIISDQTEVVIKTSTSDTDSSKVSESSETENYKLPNEIVESAEKPVVQEHELPEDHKKSQRKTRHSLGNENLYKVDEKGVQLQEHREVADETPSKIKTRSTRRTHSKEEPVSDLVKSSPEISSVETQHIVEKSDFITEVKEPTTGRRRGRSRGHQNDTEIELREKEVKSCQLDLDTSTSEVVAAQETHMDEALSIPKPEAVAVLDKPLPEEKKIEVGASSKESLVTNSTEPSGDQNIEVQPVTEPGSTTVEEAGREGQEQLKEDYQAVEEPSRPKPTPRNKKGKPHKHTKEAKPDKIGPVENAPIDIELTQPIESSVDLSPQKSIPQNMESQTSIPDLSFSSHIPEISEPPIPKTRRGRSQKYVEEKEALAVVEPTNTTPENIVPEQIQIPVNVIETDIIDQPAKHAVEVQEEPVPKTRRRTRRFSKNKEHSIIFETCDSKSLLEPELTGQSITTISISDPSPESISEVPEELTIKPRRSRSRKDSKEKEDKLGLETVKQPSESKNTLQANISDNIKSQDQISESPQELTIKPRRSRSRKDTKEREDKLGLETVKQPSEGKNTLEITTPDINKSQNPCEEKTNDILMDVGGVELATTDLEDSTIVTLESEPSKAISADVTDSNADNVLENSQIIEPVAEKSFPKTRESKTRLRTRDKKVSDDTKEDIPKNESEITEAVAQAPPKDLILESIEENTEIVPEAAIQVDEIRNVETAVSDPLDKMTDQPTPKTRKSRSRKRVKGEETASLKKDATEATHTRQLTKNKDHSGSVEVPYFAMPEEQYSKTRRGRSRKLTKEEEDFARAIEESLKDIAQKRDQGEAIDQINPESEVQPNDIDKSITDPAVVDPLVEKPTNSSNKSKKGKQRKQSISKEQVSTVLNEVASPNVISEGYQARTRGDLADEVQNVVSKPEPSDYVPDLVERKTRKSRVRVEVPQTLEDNLSKDVTADQAEIALVGPAAVQEGVAPVLEMESSTAELVFSGTAPSANTDQNISVGSVILDRVVEIHKQNTLKSKRGRPRKNTAHEEIDMTTSIKDTSKIANEQQAEELTAALEFTKTVLELVENQQTTLKAEVTGETKPQIDSEIKDISMEMPSQISHKETNEEPVFKAKRGRPRKQSKNEEAVEESALKDSMLQKEERESSEAKTFYLESVSSDSGVNIHEPASNTTEGISFKNIGEEITVDSENVSNSADSSSKSKEGMDDIVITDSVKQTSGNTCLEATMSNLTKISPEPSLKSKKGRPRKRGIEEYTDTKIAESRPSNLRETSEAESQAATVEHHVSPIEITVSKGADVSVSVTKPSETDRGSMGSIIHKAIDQSLATLDTIPTSGLSEWVGELLKNSSKDDSRLDTSHSEEIKNKDHEAPQGSLDGSTGSQMISEMETNEQTFNESEVDTLAQRVELNTAVDSNCQETKPLPTTVENNLSESIISVPEVSKEHVKKSKRQRSKESFGTESISVLDTSLIDADCDQQIAQDRVETTVVTTTTRKDNSGSSFIKAVEDTSTSDNKSESNTAVGTTLMKKIEKPTVKGRRGRSRKSLSCESVPVQQELRNEIINDGKSENIQSELEASSGHKMGLEATQEIDLSTEKHSLDDRLDLPTTSADYIIDHQHEQNMINLNKEQLIENDSKSHIVNESTQSTIEPAVDSSITSKNLDADPTLSSPEPQSNFETLVQLPEAVSEPKPSIVESVLQEVPKNKIYLETHPPGIAEKLLETDTFKAKNRKGRASIGVQDKAVVQVGSKEFVYQVYEENRQTIKPRDHLEDSGKNSEAQEVLKEGINQKFKDIVSVETEKTNLIKSPAKQIAEITSEEGDSIEPLSEKPTSHFTDKSSMASLTTKVENTSESSKDEARPISEEPIKVIEQEYKQKLYDDDVEQSIEHLSQVVSLEIPQKLIEHMPQSKKGKSRRNSKQESISLVESSKLETTEEKIITSGKTVHPEEKSRHVPPKKNRWSRRGSYAKKDDIGDSNLLKEQIIETVPEAVVSEEVVVGEQIVEINNDTVTEPDKLKKESEYAADLRENNDSFKNVDLIEANKAVNMPGISGNSLVDFNDSEIILPPKKSKRTSEVNFNFLNDSFAISPLSGEKKADSDILSFPSCDDSIMSTSLRNNIEGLIKDIDSFDSSNVLDNSSKIFKDDDKGAISDMSKTDTIKNDVKSFSLTDSNEYNKETADILKCVPPKKKKIEYSKQNIVSPSINSLLVNDVLPSEEKLIDVIPQPPKKKIQKLFESSQALEKLGKMNEMPQMSPLAKKKSFLFHQEEFAQAQKVTDVSQGADVSTVKELDVDKVPAKELLESTSLDTKDIPSGSLDAKQIESDVNKSTTIPKKRNKRKSSSHEERSQKKERRTSNESADIHDAQDDKNVTRFEMVSKSQDKNEILNIAKSITTDISVSSTPVEDNLNDADKHKNEMEVKLEEEDFKFCIQTNLTNLATPTAEELSALATATLSAIKNEVIVDGSDQIPVTSIEKEQANEASITKEEDNKELDVQKEETVAHLDPVIPGGSEASSESEFVPITLNPTVMSEKDLADAQVEITTDKVISEKKPTNLGMFSMDFLETSHGSKGTLRIKKIELRGTKVNNTSGTEFTSKAMTKEFDNRPLMAQPKAYALKSELLDILEGNSNSSTNSSGSEQKFKTSFDNYDKQTVVQGMFDFEEAIPSQIVLSNKVDPETVLMDSPKLLERLSMSSDTAKARPKRVMIQSDVKLSEGIPKGLVTKVTKPLGIPKPGQKILIKTSKAQLMPVAKAVGNKPIILSEQIIRPANSLKAAQVGVQPQGVKRQYEDIEDVETAFIIPKIAKKAVEEEIVPTTPEKPPRARGGKGGKAKILQQTIISPKGEIVQSQTATAAKNTSALVQSALPQSDDTVFDIDSMPIVLSDDILTPESIQNMPVVLSEDVISHSKPVVSVKVEEKVMPTLAKKTIANVTSKQQIVFKTTPPGTTTPLQAKQMMKPRILSNAPPSASKIPKSCTTALLATGTSADGKPTKYVLVPSTVTSAVPQVKQVKQPIVKKQPLAQAKVTGIQSSDASTPIVGNKIMIVTNQHGQQTRVVLTPQQQKAFMQAQPGSKTKAIIKGAIPKALLESAAAGPSGVVQKPVLSSVPQGATPTVSGQGGGLLMTVGKGVKPPVHPKKTINRTPSKPQKTILIKNQMGQTVRKIQGTDDADLDRQVAEQLEAIKASARLQQASKPPEIINYTNRHIAASTTPANKTAVRRSYAKKVEPVKVKPIVSTAHVQAQKSSEVLVPALAPLSPKPIVSQVQSQISPSLAKSAPSPKVEPALSSPISKTADTALQPQATVSTKSESKATVAAPVGAESKPTDRPLTQLVIQDGLGNQTTITEGQILAIPSETVDGQPQSYMLVTLDEMGNITPLNNEALMSLDPSLGLGGDLNNMVLQVDQGQGTVAALKPAEPSLPDQSKVAERLHPEALKVAQAAPEPKPAPVEQPKPQEVPMAVEQQIVIGEGVLPGADAGGQQLIVTGDPIATQKFLESLSDGSTDLANILANAEGGSVLIQADGQQILIKTNTGSPPLLGISENTEGGGNPIFGTHKPNQDILAAALANTDVFQPSDQHAAHSSPIKGMQPSQLSPSGGSGVLYPMHVGNVLETSLTLNSPIMTPLEVPSISSKKIDDDVDILAQVPKNVDLPITITDPNISQTVAQQQAIGLMELTLPISETTGSSDINSPSYSYALSTLDDSVGHTQKPFNGSMPLLTEDVTEMDNGDSSEIGKIRVAKGLQSSESGFGSNFGSLPLLPETIESSREEVVKTSCFGEMGSLPLLTEDVMEDSSSSIGSSKPPRSPPKSIERDIVDEGLSTLGGEMCSSLSEPPPDMFDLASITAKEEEISSEISSIPEPEGETLSLHSENSGEIPIQPPIVANLNDLKRPGDEMQEHDEKRQKFD